MANETHQLGKAVVPIRAALGDLDADLSDARGRIEGALGGIAKGALGIAGGLFGVGAAVTGALGSLASQAAPLEGVQRAFQGVATDADGMLASLRAGAMGMASDAQLMEQYNQAAQLVGVTFADQLPDAMQYLTKVAASTGTDLDYMLGSLVNGVGRLSPQVLDNLKVQVSLAEAMAKAAEMAGVEETQLTKAQIQAGMAAVTLEKLAENTATMPDITDNAATAMAQFTAIMENTKDQAGMVLLPLLKEVVGVFGGLAEQYGPLLVETMGRLAEMLGPLLGSALETLLPAVMSLLDALLPLGETIIDSLMPAFSSVLQVVVQLAATLIGALAPVLEAVLAAVLPVVVALVEMFAPVLQELATSLLPVLMPLIEGLAEILGRLLVAIMPVVQTLLEELTPVFIEIIEAVLPPLIDLLLVLLDLFVTYVEATLPNFIAVLEMILPVVGELARILAEVLGKALTALTNIIETVVNPALQYLIDHLFKPINEILDRMVIGVKSITDWFAKLGDTIRELDLPSWLTPGSPTPLELGIAGIGDELTRVTGLLGRFDSGLSMSVVQGSAGGRWNGDIVINGSTDPQTTATAVIRALQDRGIMPMTSMR